ncbi:MAG: hypothetical protein ABFD92_16345 [Planctomycetaceae bacterium]|nr:hypothetical protein [Planctomycetaceae bacterium]
MKPTINEQCKPAFEFTKAELLAVNNALNEVCNGFTVAPFEGKLGVDRDGVIALLDAVGKVYDLTPDPESSEACDATADECSHFPLNAQWTRDKRIVVVLCSKHLLTMKNALAEVDKELEDWEFDTRMGCTRDFAMSLLKAIDDACDRQSDGD